MSEVMIRRGMPTKCGNCLGTSLEYEEDSSGFCPRCGRVTRPAWDLSVSVPRPETARFATVGLFSAKDRRLRATPPPSAEVMRRGPFHVVTRVTVPSTHPEVIDASFESALHRATISINGTTFREARLWRTSKTVEVPAQGIPSGIVEFRFQGLLWPKITVRVDGSVLGEP